MIVHSVLFGDNQNYERMARVLEYSIGAHSPRTPFVLHRVTERDNDLIDAINQRPESSRKQLYLDNARKMKHQCRIVQDADDGEVLCLLDADTMVLGDLTAMDMQGTDLVVTHRPAGSTYPMNSGVVFARATEGVRLFFQQWLDTSTRMLADVALHREWKARFGGINQSAFGWLMYHDSSAGVACDFVGTEVPCAIWNYESECQKRELWSDRTKVVHIHGNLRKVLFNHEQPCNAQVAQLADRWRECEKQAMGVAA